jgi:hypothetical protein
MHKILSITALFLGLIAGPFSAHALPRGSATQDFIYDREVFQRGSEDYSSTQGKAPTIVNQRYNMVCLDDVDGQSAQDRQAAAIRMITENTPLAYGPYDMVGISRLNAMARATTDLIMSQTGCEIASVGVRVLTENPTDIRDWLARNNMLHELN